MTLRDLERPVDAAFVIDTDPLLARVRLSLLWLVAGSALAGTMAVFFYEPGVLEEGVGGRMEGDAVTTGMALMTAAMVVVPLTMAAVTLFLPVRVGAIAGLVVGVLLGASGLYAIVTHLAGGEWPAHLTLAALAGAVAWLVVGLSIAELRRHPHTAPAGSARVGAAGRGA